jgi:hypothetical protein
MAARSSLARRWWHPMSAPARNPGRRNAKRTFLRAGRDVTYDEQCDQQRRHRSPSAWEVIYAEKVMYG